MAKKIAVKAAPTCSLEELIAGGPLTVTVKIAGNDVVLGTLEPRSFQSGSYGYGLSGKATVPLKGSDKYAKLQMSCNLVVIGSKPGEKAEDAEVESKEPALASHPA